METGRFLTFGSFCLNTADRSLLRDGVAVALQPKTYEVLLMLIRNRDHVVSREELKNAIWGADVFVEEGALGFQINQVRKALSDDTNNPKYIKTFPKRGFRFIANVNEFNEIEHVNQDITGVQQEDVKASAGPLAEGSGRAAHFFSAALRQIKSSFPSHWWYVLTASAVYSAYFAIALLVEIAYEFDRYGATGLWIAPLISITIFLSSLSALAVGAKLAASGGRGGLLLSASIFVLAAAAVLIGACAFLPARPITQAHFQTFSAQAAYVKDFCYIVPLGLIFLVTPFHFIVAMESELQSTESVLAMNLMTGVKPSAAPEGTVFLRIWLLLLLLTGMMAYSLIGRYHLFDNLKPGPYMSLFQNLIHVRMILYFSLAIICLAWYYRALNDLKRGVLIGELNLKIN